MSRNTFLLVFALAVGMARLNGQQNAVTAISGTLYDPAGHAADNTLLTVIAVDGGRAFTQQLRTDDQGRFRFDDVPAGAVAFRTPATDIVDPSIAHIAPNSNVIDVHMGIDAVAASVRVCRDCRQPPRITKAAPAATSGAAPPFAGAEPEEGWHTFNERLIPYPAALGKGNVQGDVALEGRVTFDGATADLRVVSSSNDRLTAPALDIARQLHWRPARIREVAVSVPLRVSVEFVLDATREN